MSETLDAWIAATEELLADEESTQEYNEKGGIAGRQFVNELPQLLKTAQTLQESSNPTSVSPGKAAAAKSSRTAPDTVGKSFDKAAAQAHDVFMTGTTGKRKGY